MSNYGRVAILAPMELELAPIVQSLSLSQDSDGVWRGRHVGTEVVAMRTDIGMAAASRAATVMLHHDVSHVMIVGIAGAVSNAARIGALVAVDRVIDRATGDAFTPTLRHGNGPYAAISCGDDLITDSATLHALEREGVAALDMESAAVGRVCTEARVGWSVWRAISDHAGGGLIDADLFAMTMPDGTADAGALEAALRDPQRRQRLAQLAHDSELAATTAAHAAIATIPFAARRV